VVRSIEPASIQEGSAPVLRVAFDAIRPASADYGASTLEVDTGLEVRIGDQLMFSADAFEGNEVSAPAPFGLQPGQWDVSVQLADGRRGTLPGGLMVTPGDFPVGYVIERIADQTHSQPFDVTIHAEGANAATYTGVLQLQTNHGKITPDVTPAFSGGSVTVSVTMTGVDKAMMITAKDAAGTQADSNTFQINP
jgi:hypothetical protein